jgi:NAD(P)-dependent dehydrogenase (short-subunit alcohol dehydrogenase family)
VRLDGLVCHTNFIARRDHNGEVLNEKCLTVEGVEANFASHLLFGTFLLGQLALPLLKDTGDDARLIVVSSGCMYTTCFPDWATATSTGSPPAKFDEKVSYAYAKRGQVLLCERWAAAHPDLKVVSCHPGWTGGSDAEDAVGEETGYLNPLRTLVAGADGIAWLCAVAGDQIESGGVVPGPRATGEAPGRPILHRRLRHEKHPL